MKYLNKIFLPAIILQSVLIGGGFATGREIVQYGARFGPAGWMSGLAIFFGFTLMAILSFEACRAWKLYDYKSLLKEMIGKGWIAYELSYILLGILIIAVMASAAGEILHTTLHLNVWVGIVMIIALVGFFNFMGEHFIAKMKTLGTVALFAAYTLFGLAVFGARGGEAMATMAGGDYGLDTGNEIGYIVWTGITYVGYNLGVYPSAFFTIRTLATRTDSLVAGLLSGLLMTIPWFLTYLALMAYYPDEAILNAPVPWLIMLTPFGHFPVAVFGIVAGWTLVETATGVIHAFIGRIEVDVQKKTGQPMRAKYKALIALVALVAALMLARVGIIDLIAKGYTAMSYAMILFFAVPLLVFAPKLLFQHSPVEKNK